MNPDQALQILGLSKPDLTSAKSLQEAQEILQEWKSGHLKKAYRNLCKARHPDLGSDPEDILRRQEDMKKINGAHDILKKMMAAPRQQPRHILTILSGNTGSVNIQIVNGRLVIISN